MFSRQSKLTAELLKRNYERILINFAKDLHGPTYLTKMYVFPIIIYQLLDKIAFAKQTISPLLVHSQYRGLSVVCLSYLRFLFKLFDEFRCQRL